MPTLPPDQVAVCPGGGAVLFLICHSAPGVKREGGREGARGGQPASVSRGEAGAPETGSSDVGLRLKPALQQGAALGAQGWSSPCPTPSRKDPQLVSKPRAAPHKALPLLSPANPPSVAMATGAERHTALSVPPCSLQLGRLS